eukprot:gb/GEZN01004077.1/.p1 GENE.gb/GEZN01004077.1/~~gb/GEZN01004077.1/.p1  ORF type:complete len:608 (+),score=67.79 gb/GEZN01004077.1/:25-1848(+)
MGERASPVSSRLLLCPAAFLSSLFVARPLISLVVLVLSVELKFREVVLPFLEITYVTLFYVSVTWMAYRYRHLQPLKARNWSLLFISILSGAVLRIWILLAESPGFTFTHRFCNVTRWIVNVCYPGLTIPYLLRAYQLHRIFVLRFPSAPNSPPKLVQQADTYTALQDEDRKANGDLFCSTEEDSCVASHVVLSDSNDSAASNTDIPRDITTSNLAVLMTARNPTHFGNQLFLKWFLFAMIPFALLSVVEQIGDFELSPTFGPCVDIHQWNAKASLWSSIVFHTLEASCLLAAVILIWPVWDEFSIRSELVVVFTSDLVVSLVEILDLSLHRDFQQDYSQDLISMRCGLLFLLSVVFPLYQTVCRDQDAVLCALTKQVKVRPVDLQRLKHVLRNPKAFDLFQGYMGYIGAGQLTDFFMKVDLYEDEQDKQERLVQGMQIFREFLVPRQGNLQETNTGFNVTVLQCVTPQEVEHIRLLLTSAASNRDEAERASCNSLYRNDNFTTPAVLAGSLAAPAEFEALSQGSVACDDDSMPEVLSPAGVDEAEIDKKLFAQAKKQVYHVMDRDFFPLFQQTTEFEDLLMEARVGEGIQSRLLDWGMITPLHASL